MPCTQVRNLIFGWNFKIIIEFFPFSLKKSSVNAPHNRSTKCFNNIYQKISFIYFNTKQHVVLCSLINLYTHKLVVKRSRSKLLRESFLVLIISRKGQTSKQRGKTSFKQKHMSNIFSLVHNVRRKIAQCFII